MIVDGKAYCDECHINILPASGLSRGGKLLCPDCGAALAVTLGAPEQQRAPDLPPGTLVKCQSCGQAISRAAKSCPHCGRPDPSTSDAAKIAGGIVIAGLICGLVALCWFSDIGGCSSGPSSYTPPASKSVSLNAAVSFTGSQFVVTNADAFAWRNVTLNINSGILSSGYTYKTARLDPASMYTVGAMQFADGHGVRFDPVTMKPLTFGISADTPGGRGHYGAEFK